MGMSETSGQKKSVQNNNIVTYLSELFARLGVWSYDHKWLVLVLCTVVMVVCGYFASLMRVDNSFEAYFDHDDPVYSAYLQFRDDFGSDETSFILYAVKDKPHGPFDLEVMEKISQLSIALEDEVPFLYEVSSLANAEIVEGVEDGLEITSWDEDYPKTQSSLLEFRGKVLSKELYVGGLISADGQHGAILIDMDRSSIDPIEEIRLDPNGGDGLDNVYPQPTRDKIEEILARSEYADIRFWHSGDVALNSEMNRTFKIEGEELGLISMAVITVLLLVLFQCRILGVVGPMVVVSCSVMMAMALMGLMGWRWDMMAMMMPTMIVAIGVAASVHILSEFWLYYEKTGDRREAIRQTFYLVGPPCLLTSLTTAAGFMAMSISPIKALAHMGWYAPMGILASFFFSVTLLMFFLSFGKDGQKKKKWPLFLWFSQASGKVLKAIALFNIHCRVQILSFFIVVFIFSVFGIAKMQVDSNFIEEFSDAVPVKITTKYIDKVMGGTGSLVYLFDTGEADGIKNPAVLREIERVQEQALKQGFVVKKTYSIVDLLKDINQSFHAGDPDYYVIPDSRELISQLLLVYEVSGGGELAKYVSTDYSRANLEIRCVNTKTSVFEEFREIMDVYFEENPVEHSTIAMTGIGKLWLQLIDHIITSQIQGLSLAFVIIAILMCLIFRSVKTGLLTMIPNMSPVFLSMGLMGWLGIDLDYTRLMIATIAIGIAVDDTIHMVTRYNHEFNRCGNYEEALLNTFESVGRALVITTLVLVTGFIVFVLSKMNSTMMFGVLLSFTVTMALVADFFLMPALMLTFKPFGKEFDGEQKE